MKASFYLALYSIFILICKELCELFWQCLMEIHKDLIVSFTYFFVYRQILSKLFIKYPFDKISVHR